MTTTLPELNPGVDKFLIKKPIHYEEQHNEVLMTLRAYAWDLPLIYKGPTGSGKSTLVTYIAYLLGAGLDELTQKYGKQLKKKTETAKETTFSRLERKIQSFRKEKAFPLVTISGNEDLDADTLKGRPYALGDNAYWLNGNGKLAAQYGGIFYFDEPAEARPDVRVVLHPLSDFRKSLPIEGLGEVINAHESFGFIMTYNHKYIDLRKQFKPSLSQRFVHIPIGYPQEDVELKIVKANADIDDAMITRLIAIAQGTRNMADKKELKEGASPREVIYAATLIQAGEDPFDAAMACLAHPLTDDDAKVTAIEELIKNQFKKKSE